MTYTGTTPATVPLDRDAGYFDGMTDDGVEELSQAIHAVAGEPRNVAFNPEAVDPPWLERRRQAQLATRSDFGVFTGFSFTDRQDESGIDHGVTLHIPHEECNPISRCPPHDGGSELDRQP